MISTLQMKMDLAYFRAQLAEEQALSDALADFLGAPRVGLAYAHMMEDAVRRMTVPEQRVLAG